MSDPSAPAARRVVTTLTIAGMPAVHAVRAVYTALAAVDGIASADVALGRATVVHDGRATDAALRAAIATAGCEVTHVRSERGGLPVV